MTNAYFAEATESQFDLVFKACDEATVKTVYRSTFWTIAPSHAFCQKCEQHPWWIKHLGDFSNIGHSLPIMNRLDEEQWQGAFTYNKGHNQNNEKKTRPWQQK